MPTAGTPYACANILQYLAILYNIVQNLYQNPSISNIFNNIVSYLSIWSRLYCLETFWTMNETINYPHELQWSFRSSKRSGLVGFIMNQSSCLLIFKMLRQWFSRSAHPILICEILICLSLRKSLSDILNGNPDRPKLQGKEQAGIPPNQVLCSSILVVLCSWLGILAGVGSPSLQC